MNAIFNENDVKAMCRSSMSPEDAAAMARKIRDAANEAANSDDRGGLGLESRRLIGWAAAILHGESTRGRHRDAGTAEDIEAASQSLFRLMERIEDECLV